MPRRAKTRPEGGAAALGGEEGVGVEGKGGVEEAGGGEEGGGGEELGGVEGARALCTAELGMGELGTAELGRELRSARAEARRPP